MRTTARLICGVALAAAMTTLVHAQGGRVTTAPVTPTELGGKKLEQWIKEVNDDDPSVRERAIKMCALFGPGGKKAIPALMRQLNRNNDFSPLTNAAIAVGLIVPDERDMKNAVEALRVLVDHPQGIIRFQTAMALGNIGQPAYEATPKLAARIRDTSSWEIRKAIAYALGRCGRDQHGYPNYVALSALIDGIDDQSKEVRIESLQSLVNLGPPVDPTQVQQLIAKMQQRLKVDRDKTVSIWLRVYLIQLDPKQITEANLNYFAKHLKSTEPGVAPDAAKALGAVGEKAKDKIKDLVAVLDSSDVNLVICAVWALARMGPTAKECLPALERQLNHKESSVRSAIQEAIKSISGKKD